ncbi:hypothetical protein TCAL_07154 [Tigriopus californicus]|uniref:SEC7 domain-containing protein n=1 Tax=Tigriopus californicus TaxID=6832 RepID=A0A553NF28_TIGCA|nr:brefeldin A-inhibited guanine nucleotide-exchange protein 2-like [Tigriopus californicus]TRY63979.1 hypothetical protein TCAL_07154 [Tigriopus californicus]
MLYAGSWKMLFLEKAIENLLQDKDVKRAQYQELREACETALSDLKALRPNPESTESESGNNNGPAESSVKSSILPELDPTALIQVERTFRPFELACQATKNARLVISALDSLQKLVAYGHLRFSHTPLPLAVSPQHPSLEDRLVNAVANAFSGPHTDEQIQLQVLKALLTILTSSNVRVHDNSLLLSVRTCYNIYLASRNIINQTTAKATMSQILNYVFSAMESASAVQFPHYEGQTDDEARWMVVPILWDLVDNLVQREFLSPEMYRNMMQRDAYLVFRSLCKLSMKPLPEGTPDPKSHELRSKILSLELLLSILQNSGHAFQHNDIFVSAIKSYLCVALSQNGVSNVSEVFELSLALFISLLTKYRVHLKPQIEIFFKEICLNILEASSSSFEQKWMVVQGIGNICHDAQIVIDIFVNYDCDLEAANIFERLVDDLSKLAQGKQAYEIGATPNQLMQMRIRCLECLCFILKCMVEWCKEMYVNPHLTEKENNLETTESEESELASEDPTQLEKVKQRKFVLEYGIKLFSHKPGKGIKYLMDNGIVGKADKDVAIFLHKECNRLDKTAAGEYLGELENKELMYYYVDEINFADMDFVSALRLFLGNFRLPGEAQKIDRLMEKFASRYVECNPTQKLFKSADAAYVLAYSVIMLTTDLHSSNVKKKMTKEEFLKNNKGINDSEDIPPEYLGKIYDEIASNEIKMKGTSLANNKLVITDLKQRTLLWNRESESISQTAGALMESASSRCDAFTSAKRLDHVKPMFKLIWSPLLATFSVGLQSTDDMIVVQLCLEGIRCCIRLANIFHFTLERNAFIQALARFTLLTENSNVKEMRSKNIEAIKTLISVAHTDGNYLEHSWLDIMKCISQLEYAQLLGSLSTNGSDGSMDPNARLNLVNDMTSEANSQSIIVAVDRIFTGSKNLNGNAIVHFFTALCDVSKEEIGSKTNVRMYSLIKLVEISYYNMERIRLEWSRIWHVVGNHFNLVGCKDDQNVSFFAVDSLKQLSLKFLEKGELQNFHFQKDFLRPFEFIMKNNKSPQIRDMVIRCLSQMIQSQSQNIKSGWKNFFATFGLAASDDVESIVALSHQTTQRIVTKLISDNKLVLKESFQDCVKCLSEFACNQMLQDVAMESLQLIRKCAEFVNNHQEQFENFPGPRLSSSQVNGDQDEHAIARGNVWIRGWFPVLFELSCVINKSKLDIRTRSLTILFDIVKQHGQSFEENWWRDLYQVLFRIFEVGKFDLNDLSLRDHREWIDTTCNHALYAMTDVFSEFYDVLVRVVLTDLLSQYQWCIQQPNEQLSKSAISCFQTLVATNQNRMDQRTFALIISFLSETIKDTSVTVYQDEDIVVGRVHVHLDVLEVSMNVLTSTDYGQAMEEGHLWFEILIPEHFEVLRKLLRSLEQSFNESKTVLEVTPMGSRKRDVSIMVKQETKAAECLLLILIELCTSNLPSEYQKSLEKYFVGFLVDVLGYFLSITAKTQQEQWDRMLSSTLGQVLAFQESMFLSVMSSLYNLICDILSIGVSKDLRSVACQMLKRIGALYDIPK